MGGFLSSLFGSSAPVSDDVKARVLSCLENYWMSLNDIKAFSEKFYDPESKKKFMDDFSGADGLKKTSGVKLNTAMNREKVQISLKKENDQEARFTVRGFVEYYFTNTSDNSVVTDQDQFNSERGFQPIKFDLTFSKRGGELLLTDVTNDMF